MHKNMKRIDRDLGIGLAYLCDAVLCEMVQSTKLRVSTHVISTEHRKQYADVISMMGRSLARVAEPRQTCASKWARNTHVSRSPLPGSAHSQPPSPAIASSYNTTSSPLLRSNKNPLLLLYTLCTAWYYSDESDPLTYIFTCWHDTTWKIFLFIECDDWNLKKKYLNKINNIYTKHFYNVTQHIIEILIDWLYE